MMADNGLNSFREQFLTCSICLEEFVQPRQLPCLHIFCHECLQEIVSYRQPQAGWLARQDRKVTCPLCKKEHNVPPDGVEGFPHDFRTQSLLELSKTNSLSSPTSPVANEPLYPNLAAVPSAPPIDIDNQENKAVRTRLENQLEKHTRQLAKKKADLTKIMQGVDEIDSVYEAVYQCMLKREDKICQQVKERSTKLKLGIREQQAKSKQTLDDRVNILSVLIGEMEQESIIAREVLASNCGSQMEQYCHHSKLMLVDDAPLGNVEDPKTWMAPNVIFKSNLVVESDIERYLSPVMGSLCTIEKGSRVFQNGTGGPQQTFDVDITKPTFPFTHNKSTKVINLNSLTKWKGPASFSGFGVDDDHIVLCLYHDMTLVVCRSRDGQVVWKSRQEELGGFFKVLSSLVSTSQPSDAVAVSVQGADFMAISYPHQYEIKLFKSEQNHWHNELRQYSTAFRSDDVKPDQMFWAGDELVFLEYSGPAVQFGMHRKKLHVLSTTTIPFQRLYTVDPSINVHSFAIIPSPAFNRLYYCIASSGIVALDMHGNHFWSVNISDAKGICTDKKGYIYVTSGSEGSSPNATALHVLWHDGTLLQTYSKSDLNLVSPQKIRLDRQRQNIVISDANSTIAVFSIRYL